MFFVDDTNVSVLVGSNANTALQIFLLRTLFSLQILATNLETILV